MPGTALRASCPLTYLTLTTTLSGMYYFVPTFTMRKTEVQRVRGHTASMGQGEAVAQAASSHLRTCPPIPSPIRLPTHTTTHFISPLSNRCLNCKSVQVTLLLKNLLRWLPAASGAKPLPHGPCDRSPRVPPLPHLRHATRSRQTKALASPDTATLPATSEPRTHFLHLKCHRVMFPKLPGCKTYLKAM